MTGTVGGKPQGTRTASSISPRAAALTTLTPQPPAVPTPPAAPVQGSAASFDRGASPAFKVNLVGGPSPSAAPVPAVAPLPASAVSKDANTLGALTPRARADILSGLGVELQQAEAMPHGAARDQRLGDTRAAVNRVMENTDGIQLKSTLQAGVINKSLGFITETVGLDKLIDVAKARGFNVNDTLATSDTVKHRGATTYEAQKIRENFEYTLDPETVRFRFTTGVQTQGASAMVLGNTINVDPTHPKWELAPGTTQPRNPRNAKEYNEVLLAHEPAHVWSYQHQGSVYAVNSMTDQINAMAETGSRGGAYGYKPDKKRSYFSYGEEQRAAMVQDWVAAKDAQRRGEATVQVGGSLRRRLEPAEAIKELKPHIEEMRAAGVGQPKPAGDVQGIRCDCHTMSSGLPQDGIAGALGEHADALVAGVGKLSMDGLKSGEPLKMAAGAVGVAGAVVVSMLPRSANANGANGGGSDILDQAGIPRGVGVEGGGVNVSAKFGYEAGVTNKRVDVAAGYQGEVAGVQLNAQADARVGLDRRLQSFSTRLSAERGLTSLALDASAQFGVGRELSVGTVGLDAAHGPYSLSARADATWNGRGVQSALLSGRLDAPQGSLSGQVLYGPDMKFQQAEVEATVRAGQTSIQGSAVVLSTGLDSLQAGLGTRLDGSRVTLSGSAANLTSLAPSYTAGFSLARPNISFNLSGTMTPATKDHAVMVGIAIPLP